jgi:drug/metabolite transporter (DMT)-like permease
MSRRLAGYVFALGAATAYGVNSVLIRFAVGQFGSPLSGLAIGIFCGLLALAPVAVYMQRRDGRSVPRQAALLLVLSGSTFSLGLGSNFLALSLLPVTVASPIASSYPMVTVVVSRLFLQESERVNWRVALGAFLVVAGGALVVLGRPAP